MTTEKIRVRFAPSPTGNLHIGGMRTALFNQLFARHNKGIFAVRVEDTDLARSKKEHVDAQLQALEWCGIVSDEDLVYQSERTQEYQKILDALLEKKSVYYCYCTPEEIEARIRAAGNKEEHYGYDGFCRNKEQNEEEGKPRIIRFAVPETVQEVVVQDLILGTVTFDKNQFDDFIIVRSDGSPTYNFVVVVDDEFMDITHIIRGQEHLGNTPKQMLLAQACGFTCPQFAHIPLILSPQGGKLSKRDGAVDVLQFKKDGYLPNALVNYMVRLGWSHGDQELFTRKELIEYFSLKAVGKKAAVFDIQKLQWVNSEYLKKLSPRDCFEWLEQDVCNDLAEKLSGWSEEQREQVIVLYQERVKTGQELCDALIALHTGPAEYDKEAVAQWFSAQARSYCDAVAVELKALDDFSKDAIAGCIKTFCKTNTIKLVTIAQPLRIALTGGITSPGVFDLLAILGKDEALSRIHALQRYVESR